MDRFWKRLFFFLLLLINQIVYSKSTDVQFESGEIFQTTASSNLGQDPKMTGSSVFDATGIENSRLTLNFFVRDFKSPSSKYFRAHPVFMKCLQRIRTHLENDIKPKTVVIKRGYIESTSTNIQDVYARSGTAAILGYKTSTSDVLPIAEAALLLCTPMFAEIQRDIGLIIKANSLHIHMTGSLDEGPHYESDGYTANNTAQFKEWCLTEIDNNINPPATPDCEDSPELDSGKTHPDSAASPESVVGGLDQRVIRDTVEDFDRLIQFAGRNIAFENKERTSAWCGKQGRACVDCSTGIKGQARNSRCANRLMTPRLYNRIRLLQKMVRDKTPSDKLKVKAAWAEPYADAENTNGDYPQGSLHYEGRQAIISLTSITAANKVASLKSLSKMAICSGFDYVKNTGEHVVVAVRKQALRRAEYVEFPKVELLVVVPPHGKKDLYQVQGPLEAGPIFDSDNQGTTKLSRYGQISMFKDPNNRYFRLDPLIVKCHEEVEHKQNKWNKDTGDSHVAVVVDRGYRTKSSQNSLLQPTDPRFDMHPTGRAMEITFPNIQSPSRNTDNSTNDVHRLTRLVIDQCGPLFSDKKLGLRIGIYHTSVYVDLRDTEGITAWVSDGVIPPPGRGSNKDQYVQWLNKRHQQAVESRIIDPESLKTACTFSNPPHKRSIHFNHDHTEAVKRRRRDTTGSETDCQPKTGTLFCTNTKKHRDHEVKLIKTEVKRKYLHRDEDEVMAALDGCLGACGTCLKGSVFEDKIEHCNNLIHWVPFDLMNDAPDVTNIYARSNAAMRKHACRPGQECLERAPLFSLLAPSVEHLYRPDPTKSVEEQLYPAADNPTPLMDLMLNVYVIHAKGIIKFWVKDAVEMTSLKDALKVAMVFNKDVTLIEVYVPNAGTVSPVSDVIENWLVDWVSNSCPRHSREVITPFEVKSIPDRVKRSIPEFSYRDELLEQRRQWEHTWLNSRLH